ncbi:MAG TPA: efflux RND transporter periplasmic adaptor subunit [Halieaceae bacterium]|nr:MAG: hypothetical protein DRQ98_01690 [Gammaproteobacteria bacterium]HDY82521.1 efflux RND transporter periplasmic adaptor subunit [Halieaceae bacterium]
MNRWSLATLVFALAASPLIYDVAKAQARAPSSPAQELFMSVKVFTLKTDTASESRIFPGRVDAGDSALLAFRVGGQLRELKVLMGDSVKEGAVLAELDPTDYQLNLNARRAEFDLAQLEADRASALFAQQLISEDHYDTARTVLATSRARLEQAREQLSFCKLAAPFAGAIAFTYVMPSEVVAPQQPILNLQDTSTLEIQFNLPMRFQPLLEGKDGAVFAVAFDLMPGVLLDARHKEVNMQPDPDTNSYPVTLLVDPPDDFSARPGMPVTVHLHHRTLSGGRWMLPREALFERSGEKARVWRIEPSKMTIHKVVVELGEGGVLLKGLNPGDRIVAAGVDRLREGQRVRPWVREGGL